jgi:DNA gyrase subunit A
MARSQSPSRANAASAALDGDFTENIIDIDVTSEMEGSFLEYAYSVIYSRALPDARDGLKPVQRRILYMMSDMGLRPDRGHVKSARVVGEVMGKLHPHGDAAIYDAMVRMAQDFSLRLPLIDGHGNFGSLDDGPAAPRYTEARLAAAAMTMTEHLDEDVVDFVPNYDNQLTQPDVLPAAFPNLLVNGTTGIAVGMATNMAPHNLVEVIAAARHLIATPDATLEDVMRFVPGPDLPTGGRIVGLDGIRDAYATGRGSFKTRAKVEIEQLTARRTGLVVTELPYMVGPEKVIEKIKDAVNAKKLTGISDVMDLTDRKHGLRLVIEIKNGFNPNAVLQQLYRFTPMEDSFGINNVTLVDGQPQTLGLLQLLQVYVGHRLSVVRRRTAFRLGKKKDRLHLVEGLLIAIVDIDEVIQIIRSSDEASAARERLMSIYDLSEIQANYILELRLRQLTGRSPNSRRSWRPTCSFASWCPENWPKWPRNTAPRGARSSSNPRPYLPPSQRRSQQPSRPARARPPRSRSKYPTTLAGQSSAPPARSRAPPTRSRWPNPARGASTMSTARWSRQPRAARSARSPRRAGCSGYRSWTCRRSRPCPACPILPGASQLKTSSPCSRANRLWRSCRWMPCWPSERSRAW